MNWFVDALGRAREEETLVDGLKAYVRMYYGSNSDATEVEPDVIRHLEQLLYAIDGGPDVEDLIVEVEEEINGEGGVMSATDNTRHSVCTYKQEEESK